jgi:hypothetical protein
MCDGAYNLRLRGFEPKLTDGDESSQRYPPSSADKRPPAKSSPHVTTEAAWGITRAVETPAGEGVPVGEDETEGLVRGGTVAGGVESACGRERTERLRGREEKGREEDECGTHVGEENYS